MLNTFCEEQTMQDKILEYHEGKLATKNIPKWMNINCPFCGKEQPLRSIRNVSLRFNTRNMGDVTVEIFCVHCNKMDTLYFREDVDIDGFISLLKNETQPKTKPIIEEEMFKLGYNNTMKIMSEESK